MNLKPLAYALGLWRRRWAKNTAVGGILALLVAVIGAGLLTASALERASLETLEQLPAITVQRLQAGRLIPIPAERVYAIAELAGVDHAAGRIWGYHYFAPAAATFQVMGVDPWLPTHRAALTRMVGAFEPMALNRRGGMLVGPGVLAALEQVYHRPEQIEVRTATGDMLRLPLVGVLDERTSALSADLVLVSEATARAWFGLAEHLVTDIVVRVPNPDEVPVVARKIQACYADVRVVTRAQLASTYRALFDTRAGVFMGVGLIALLAFGVVVFDRASGLSTSERHELGVLKATGWSSGDLIRLKLTETAVTASGGLVLGAGLALVWVVWLGAPGLLEIASGWSRVRPGFNLPTGLEVGSLVRVVLVALAATLGAALIPTWRMAVRDADELLRS